MKRNLLSLVALAIVFVFGITSCQDKTEIIGTGISSDNTVETDVKNGDIIPGQYIVVIKSGEKSMTKLAGITDYGTRQEIMTDEVNKFLADNELQNTEVEHVYANSVYGFSAKMTLEDVENLRSNKNVIVEPDRYVILKKPVDTDPVDTETTSTQEVPYGITRVNGGVDGSGLTAWIIDSGIDLDHEDLNVDVARSVDFTGSRKGAEDENGHGTHVAGTVAAINNSVGVIGVAAGATVVAVRVLDRRGSGSYSGVIAGVDYVGANGSNGDVANMSLGGPVSDALDQAVINASQSGVKFALAAGNESDDAIYHSPARANGPNIYTISAMDINDTWAYFSNYGSPVDYCAPGVSILSTWKSGGYNTISGTSMASPHAAGVLLLGNASTDGYVIGDPDGDSDPIIVH